MDLQHLLVKKLQVLCGNCLFKHPKKTEGNVKQIAYQQIKQTIQIVNTDREWTPSSIFLQETWTILRSYELAKV